MNKMSTLIVSNSNGEETSFEIVDASARGDINTLTVTVDELLDFEANAFVNEIWFRGDSYEIGQLRRFRRNSS